MNVSKLERRLSKRVGEIDLFIAAHGRGLANFILNDLNPAWKDKAGEFIERVEKRLRGLMSKE